MSNCSKKEYTRVWHANKRAERRALGLCIKCGECPKPKSTRCEKCLALERAYSARRRQNLKDRGLCYLCFIEPRVAGLRLCSKCRESERLYNKTAREKVKEQILDHYGRKCICCGESELLFLDLDHINNDGYQHRKEIGIKGGSEFYRWVIRNNFPSDLQILCANCNHGKARNNGVCPHQDSNPRKY